MGQIWDETGAPLRVHLEKSFEATGRRSPRLDHGPVPPAFERAMLLWLDLHQNRDTGGMAISRLSWRDLHAYAAVMQEEFSRGDLEAVRVIEEEFFASKSEADKHRRDAEDRVRASKERAAARRRR